MKDNKMVFTFDTSIIEKKAKKLARAEAESLVNPLISRCDMLPRYYQVDFGPVRELLANFFDETLQSIKLPAGKTLTRQEVCNYVERLRDGFANKQKVCPGDILDGVVAWARIFETLKEVLTDICAEPHRKAMEKRLQYKLEQMIQ